MSLPTKLVAGLVTLALAIPSAAAKIYPGDFLNPMQIGHTPQPAPQTVPAQDDSGSDWLTPTQVPDGSLTRAEFVDAVGTRLYSGTVHSDCFANLANSFPVNYELLYKDVNIDMGFASSTCVLMHNGYLHGYKDGYFRPDQTITAAEAASILATLTWHVRAPRKGEAWYGPAMEAIRSVDSEFTLRAWEPMTGRHMLHTMCMLKGASDDLKMLQVDC